MQSSPNFLSKSNNTCWEIILLSWGCVLSNFLTIKIIRSPPALAKLLCTLYIYFFVYDLQKVCKSLLVKISSWDLGSGDNFVFSPRYTRAQLNTYWFLLFRLENGDPLPESPPLARLARHRRIKLTLGVGGSCGSAVMRRHIVSNRTPWHVADVEGRWCVEVSRALALI